MPRVEQRHTIWMAFFLIALVIGGLCATGYWLSYDINCGAGHKTWVWTELPPQYKCRASF